MHYISHILYKIEEFTLLQYFLEIFCVTEKVYFKTGVEFRLIETIFGVIS